MLLLTRALPAAAAVTFAAFLLPALAADDPPPAAVKLPLTRVALFTAGVGYFHREGTVDGHARVELRVPEEDVNDLIKTLVAADADGNPARVVTFDPKAPAEVTLRAFKVDLTSNPSVADLLDQVRGERIEMAEKAGTVTTGAIVSMEWSAPPPAPVLDREGNEHPGPVDPKRHAIVNLMTADGLESVPLPQVKRIRFLKPELQAEFKKALEALAAARGGATKAVGVTFGGNGARKVSVGYVAEAPLWKPSYRLTLDDKAAKVQGWAAVENTTDEDWENVRVALVSGRPMTFQMDLYDPLFIPRPTVEPELYASLRPPVYQGAATNPGALGFGGGQVGNMIQQGGNAGNLGVGGGVLGNLGGGGDNPVSPLARPSVRGLLGNRLDYQQFRERTAAGGKPEAKPSGPAPTASADFGQSFRYDVAEPVSLPRLKSALLPVLNEPADATRVSVFNPAVLGNHPLLGVRLTNTGKRFLAQGPVAVYDGGTYAGDARLPDVKPGESRLLSYAIDLNTDATMPRGDESKEVLTVKIADGAVRESTRFRRTTRYRFSNRAADARTVLVTQVAEKDWKLVTPEKPDERTADLYRFGVKLPASGVATLDVVEERTADTAEDLAKLAEADIDRLTTLPVTSAAVKAALAKLRADRDAVAATEKNLKDEEAAVKAVVDGQVRLRENIAKLPKESQAFQRYLKKFDDQETEIEKRQAAVRDLTAELARQRTKLAESLKAVTAD